MGPLKDTFGPKRNTFTIRFGGCPCKAGSFCMHPSRSRENVFEFVDEDVLQVSCNLLILFVVSPVDPSSGQLF